MLELVSEKENRKLYNYLSPKGQRYAIDISTFFGNTVIPPIGPNFEVLGVKDAIRRIRESEGCHEKENYERD